MTTHPYCTSTCYDMSAFKSWCLVEKPTWNRPERSPAYSNHFSLGTGIVECTSPTLGKPCMRALPICTRARSSQPSRQCCIKELAGVALTAAIRYTCKRRHHRLQGATASGLASCQVHAGASCHCSLSHSCISLYLKPTVGACLSK